MRIVIAITLGVSLDLFGSSLCAQNIADPGMIDLPDEPPTVVVPPNTKQDSRFIDDRNENDQQMQKKREAREKREEKFKKPPRDREKERNAQLLNDMVEPRPNQFFLATNLIYPIAEVTGPREEYIFEPSVVISAFLRIGELRVYSDFVVWTGFRLGTFSGTGTYDSIPGRFGFSYFGPMIGVDKIDPAPLSVPRDAVQPGVDPGKFLSSRSGAFFVAGVAGQSRFAETYAGAGTPKEDLNDAGAGFDPPGIWGEAHYAWIHFGAVSINFLAGTQLGSGKTILYFGGGFGGIY